eukprot:834810-Pyramimonas_sp.AAC.1
MRNAYVLFGGSDFEAMVQRQRTEKGTTAAARAELQEQSTADEARANLRMDLARQLKQVKRNKQSNDKRSTLKWVNTRVDLSNESKSKSLYTVVLSNRRGGWSGWSSQGSIVNSQ